MPSTKGDVYMEILKIALTGGPCGGKTTSIQAIEEEFKEKGYHVIVVPEAATILINSGIRPFGNNALTMDGFQKYVMETQLFLEEQATKAAKEIDAPTIIVCDRGLPDDKAYVSDETFKKLIKDFNVTQFELLNRYNLVIHLTTAADGKEEYYTTSNNGARIETPEEARQKDRRTLESWLGHDNLKIMGNDTDFETKIANVIREIYQMLKAPYPIQKQEKYLVDTFDKELIMQLHPVIIDIEQYVQDKDNGDIIYRKSTKDNETKYTKITKTDTQTPEERIVTRKNISEDEYYSNMPSNIKPIRKRRYCFAYQNQYFRLDEFESGLTILEIEDTNKTRRRVFPNFVSVLEDVTTNPDYKNVAIYNRLNATQKTYQKKC